MAQQQWWQITRNDEVPLVAPNRQRPLGVLPQPRDAVSDISVAVDSSIDDFLWLQRALLRTRPLLNEIYRAPRLQTDVGVSAAADTYTSADAWAYLDGSG